MAFDVLLIAFDFILLAFDFNLLEFDSERAEFNSTDVEECVFLSACTTFNPLTGLLDRVHLGKTQRILFALTYSHFCHYL